MVIFNASFSPNIMNYYPLSIYFHTLIIISKILMNNLSKFSP